MARRGRKAVHIGYNSACKMAGIPQAFTWQHAETQTEIMVFANNNYGSTIFAPPYILQFLYSMDNGAPPSPSEVQSFWENTQSTYPGAKLILSSLDDFARNVSQVQAQLPVVTQEIGDSWLYGAPADPKKLGIFREMRRARNEAVAAGTLDPLDTNLLAAERAWLIGGPEHNWGLSIGQYFPSLRSPAGNWSNAQFHAVSGTAPYEFIESGWAEKRDFTMPNTSFMPASPGWQSFVSEVENRISELTPAVPSLDGYTRMSDPSKLTMCGDLAISFNASDGAVAHLMDVATGYDWAQPGLLRFTYQTYTLEDFNAFNAEYNPNCGPPCGDFSKAGMDSASPVHSDWIADTVNIFKANAGQGCQFLVQLILPTATTQVYGGMQQVWVAYNLTNATNGAPDISLELQWFNKTATRLAEAAWLSFPLAVPDPTAWRLQVMGGNLTSFTDSAVNPLDVILDGTRHIHAVWDGFYCSFSNTTTPLVYVQSLDAPVVSPGDIYHLLNYSGSVQPEMSGGMHVNLYNNLWGTAFPQWYSDDAKFRFNLFLNAPAGVAAHKTER